MIEPGIYPHLSNEGYHADPAISRSGIIHFMDSPYKYWAECLAANKPKKVYSDAMRFGSAFHTYILERDKFWKEYDLEPKRVYLKYDGKDAYEEYKKRLEEMQHSEKTVLSNDEHEILQCMRAALIENKQAWELIEGNVYEQSYFWKDEHSEVMVKCRPDIINERYIVDLKTVTNASEKSIQRAVFDYGYDIQMALIRDGVYNLTGNKIESFILICVEKAYPFQIGIYILDSEVLERAKMNYKNALLQVKECLRVNVWPSYEPSIITLPSWLK